MKIKLYDYFLNFVNTIDKQIRRGTATEHRFVPNYFPLQFS